MSRYITCPYFIVVTSYSVWLRDGKVISYPPPPLSLRKTWGCGAADTEKSRAAYETIREEHGRLGPMRYGEMSVLVLFILLVALWFTRDPRFIDGWATHAFNSQAE